METKTKSESNTLLLRNWFYYHWKGMFISLALIFLTMFLGAIFNQPIIDWTKSHILGEEPYPQITITKIYRISNSNFTNFSILKTKEYGSIEFFSHHMETGPLLSKDLTVRMDTKEVFFVENSHWIKGLSYPMSYVTESGQVYQQNCVFNFYSRLINGSNPKSNTLLLASEWPSQKKNNTENLTEFAININNGGTEVIKDVYIEFCAEGGRLIDFSGDAQVKDNCLEIELPYLYPEQDKTFELYISGQNIDKITFHSNMDTRRISNYIVNEIKVVYANSTCDEQKKTTMYSNEFGLLLNDLY
jgi:hypothetical protein